MFNVVLACILNAMQTNNHTYCYVSYKVITAVPPNPKVHSSSLKFRVLKAQGLGFKVSGLGFGVWWFGGFGVRE